MRICGDVVQVIACYRLSPSRTRVDVKMNHFLCCKHDKEKHLWSLRRDVKLIKKLKFFGNNDMS